MFPWPEKGSAHTKECSAQTQHHEEPQTELLQTHFSWETSLNQPNVDVNNYNLHKRGTKTLSPYKKVFYTLTRRIQDRTNITCMDSYLLVAQG